MISFDRSIFYPIKHSLKTYDLIKKFNFDIENTRVLDDFTPKDISSLEIQKNNSLLFL